MAPDDSKADDAKAAEGRDMAQDLARGVSRLMLNLGYSPLTEYTLGSGRRADVAAINGQGKFIIVEIKSSVQDFRADDKWPMYIDYCDSFFFAVHESFPADILPANVGLILADRYGGTIVRDAESKSVAGSRRKAETLKFARTAAHRLHRKLDPDITTTGDLIDRDI